MTRLRIFLSRAFPFAARDESINCVIERSRQSRASAKEGSLSNAGNPRTL